MTNRDRIVCKDGFSVSVQASAFHYCWPRVDNADKYSKVELGFPSSAPPDYIAEYAEDGEDLTGTVYPYVPVSLVWQMLEEHGGVVNGSELSITKE